MDNTRLTDALGGPEALTGKKQTTVEKPTQKKSLAKKHLVQPKQLDLSVTILVGNSDITVECLKKMEDFLEKECISD